MKKKYKIIIFLVSVVCILTSYAYFIEPNMLKVEHQTIKLDCLKSNVSNQNFIQISDLHFTKNTSFETINRISDEIIGKNPVAIFITGDLISDKNGIDNVIVFVNKFSHDFPVYIVFGNWDYWVLNDTSDFKKLLENTGASVLVNSSASLLLNETTIEIIGIKDPYSSKNSADDLQKALSKSDQNSSCMILLAHSPDIIKIASRKNINLILVGHTHGGQVYIPFLTRLIIPSNKDGKGFVKGLYRYENTQMYINRGIGTSSFPFRFLNVPEITSISLTN